MSVSGGVSRERAGTVALAGKVAAAAILLLAGYVVWRGLPGVATPRAPEVLPIDDVIAQRLRAAEVEEDRPEDEGDAAGPATAIPVSVQSDFTGMVERLKLGGGITKPEEPEPEPADEEDENPAADAGEDLPPPPPPKPNIEVFYLGMIDEGSRRVALVRVGDRQRFVPVGSSRTFDIPENAFDGMEIPPEERPETTVVEVRAIADDRIVVSVDGEDPAPVERRPPEDLVVATRDDNPAPAPRSPAPGGSRSSGFDAERQQLQEERARLIQQRPKRDDFTGPDGETDVEAYRNALREWSSELRDLSQRQRN